MIEKLPSWSKNSEKFWKIEADSRPHEISRIPGFDPVSDADRLRINFARAANCNRNVDFLLDCDFTTHTDPDPDHNPLAANFHADARAGL
jgi:hypothetical protein